MSYSPKPNATTGTSGGEGGMYRSEAEKAEAGPNPKVMSVKKPLAPKHVEDAGPASFKVSVPKDNKAATSPRHPMGEEAKKCGPAGEDMMAMSEETIKADHNGQWRIEKSAFKELQGKIERQGHSKDSAAAITASIGRKELGQKEMTARSKAGMNKVDPDENVNIPHPKGKAKMANGVNKDEGTNQRIANPPQDTLPDARGRVHMVKDEGTNEEASPNRPHNKGKFKVVDEVKEVSSEKASPKGKPYSDKGEIKKGNKVLVGTGTNDENKSPGRHSGFGL
ncbi:unnamed protein product [Sphagnum balticum]